MKENKVNIEVIEVIADDGKVFSLDSERISSNLRKEAEEYNKQYHRWYDFKNFKVDKDKLKVWKPENWEHFKWEICRNFIYRAKPRDQYMMTHQNYDSNRDYDIDVFNGIKTSDEFVKFINKIVYPNDRYGFQYELHYDNIFQMYQVLYGSGLVETPQGCLRIAIDEENYEAVKYCVETLKFNVSIHNICSALKVNIEETRGWENKFYPSENDIAVEFKPIFAKNGENDKELDNFQKNKYYYSKESRNISEFLIKNYNGDLTELCIKLIGGDDTIHGANMYKIHYFYNIYKELNITLPIHSESVETIIQFNYFWQDKCKWFEKIKKYNISLYNGCADSIEKSKLPSKEIVESIFLQIKHAERKKIKDIYTVLKSIDVDSDKIMYYFNVITPYYFSQAKRNYETLPDVLVDEFNAIRDVLSTNKPDLETIFGLNEEEIQKYGNGFYKIENKKGLPLEYFKKFNGMNFQNDTEMIVLDDADYEISKDRDVCTCKEHYSEALREHTRQMRNVEKNDQKFPEKKDYVYWRCPVHGKISNVIYVYYTERNITFEEFLKATDRVSKDNQKKKLQSEIDELEKAQKELEEKKKKIEKRINGIK